ncbi:Lrp/AsnC family transcriptional regulator [Alkalimarinus coralli]|uniref:Lrp/AsnC family transcriptional regulator n=1 Tax=Alkalimarinus coralli TaxID=2935863 RepID=UPI00202B23F7|nr:Lrp/AsnC family transcriptional regulator [Alkalimarinus coralli]
MKPVDQRLLSLLKTNARMSTSDLARKLDLSRSTIQSRIKKLEQEGIIKGYTVVYGDEYQNRLVSAHVLIKVMQKLTVKTNNALKEMPELSALHAISGDFDLIAILKTESTQELSQILDRISNLEGVERTNSSVILETKFSR